MLIVRGMYIPYSKAREAVLKLSWKIVSTMFTPSAICIDVLVYSYLLQLLRLANLAQSVAYWSINALSHVYALTNNLIPYVIHFLLRCLDLGTGR